MFKKFSLDVEVWLLIIIFGGAAILLVAYLLNAGTVNRFFATIGQDKTTRQDVVYQANGVRVYSFTHEGNRCYMADDPQGGAGIYCLPILPVYKIHENNAYRFKIDVPIEILAKL
jgi:hypothetical protein